MRRGTAFGHICLSVCLSVCNVVCYVLKALAWEVHVFSMQEHLRTLQVKFVYRGHRVEVKLGP